MRIALVHNLAFGGARRAMQEHQLRLAGEVTEFCLQSASPVTASPRVFPYVSHAERLAPAIRPLPRHTDLLRLMWAWRALARAVDRSGCDVVLAHPCQYLQAPAALRWTAAPSVYFCHEPRRVDYEPAAASKVNSTTRRLYGPLHRLERRLDRAAVAASDRILTNSRFTAGRIERAYGRSPEPVALGVGEVFRSPGPVLAPTHLLSVGSLIPSKGHDLAIAAAGRTVRRRRLVVVAPSDAPEERRRLGAIAERNAVELEIRVGVSDEELRELYRGAAATVYLAREEPLGLVSLEAQACGSPVVVADDGGLPETIVDGKTGWAVAREDPSAAARAIDLLEDPGLREAVSARAREHGGAQTWERSTERVRAAIEQAAGR